MAYRTTTATPYVGLGARLVLTLVGAAGLIVGAFMTWWAPLKGSELALEALWKPTFRQTSTFVATVGFAAIVVALVAIVGMAFGTGWLTRIAGVVGIIGFVLFAVEVYRAPGTNEIGVGAWVSLAGAVLVLIAGFLGGRRSVTTPVVTETIADDD